MNLSDVVMLFDLWSDNFIRRLHLSQRGVQGCRCSSLKCPSKIVTPWRCACARLLAHTSQWQQWAWWTRCCNYGEKLTVFCQTALQRLWWWVLLFMVFFWRISQSDMKERRSNRCRECSRTGKLMEDGKYSKWVALNINARCVGRWIRIKDCSVIAASDGRI